MHHARLTSILALLLGPVAAAQTASNLGLAGTHNEPEGKIFGDLSAFPVGEAEQGVDLDGNGSIGFAFLHVHKLSTGVTSNTGIAMRTTTAPIHAFSVGDRLCIARTDEDIYGVDLNGDGDVNDRIPAVYDSVTGTTSVIGVAMTDAFFGTSGKPLAMGNHALFTASESGQGSDLNGDGDTSDIVLHKWTVGASAAHNVGLAVNRLLVGRTSALFVVRESTQGVDLNSDGDLLDEVVHALDLATNAVSNLGIASMVELAGAGDLYAFVGNEADMAVGTDWNGDGDSNDLVLFAFIAPPGVVRTLGSAVNAPGVVDGYSIAWAAPEPQQGTDWNGDGDSSDYVVHVHNARNAVTSNTGLAVDPLNVNAGFTAQSEQILVFVHEQSQGASSRNGDADVGDIVAAVYHQRTGTTTNLGLASSTSLNAISREVAAFVVDEAKQGGQDINGDGRLTLLAAVHAFANGQTTVLAPETPSWKPALAAGLVAFFAQEGPFVADLNGDGDVLDQVLMTWNAATGTLMNHGLAVELNQIRSSRTGFVLTVRETMQGMTDLNGDSDVGDRVVHVLKL